MSFRAFCRNCIISFFLSFGMVLETHMNLCVTVPDFLEKLFLPQKLGKWAKNGFLTNRFFVCWCKIRKAKSYFNDSRVGVVKNGCDRTRINFKKLHR